MFGGGRHAIRAGGACRITVVGSRRRVDLSVPAATPVIELLPRLVQLTGEDDGHAAGASWLLTRVTGEPLQAERSLGEAGVLDGELLYLDGAGQGPVPVVEDFSEAVAAVVDASGATWSARRGRQLLDGLAGATWLAGAATALTAAGNGDPRWAVAALAVAAGLDAAAAALTWWLGRGLAGAVAAAAALPYWAIGGASLAGVAGRGTAPDQLVAAAAACLAGAGACWLAAPRLRRPAAALAIGLTPLTAAGAAVRFLGATPVEAAAAVTILALASLTALPGLAAGTAGLTRSREAFPPAAVAPSVTAARRTLAWLLVAAGADLTVGLAVLGLAADATARALCAAAVVAIALRARHHRFAAEVLPLALAAAAGVLVLEIGLTAGAGAPVRLGVLLVTGAALTGAASLPLGRPLSPHGRRWVSRLEVLTNATLVPLALGAAGVFAAAADIGRRIASA